MAARAYLGFSSATDIAKMWIFSLLGQLNCFRAGLQVDCISEKIGIAVRYIFPGRIVVMGAVPGQVRSLDIART